jgi:D-alanyl-D-alanine carboxypeptidase/D-alanyl-D-alanine-endopeptidase (penicillin-binding protein 4)
MKILSQKKKYSALIVSPLILLFLYLLFFMESRNVTATSVKNADYREKNFITVNSIREMADNTAVKKYISSLKRYNYSEENIGLYFATANDSIIFAELNSEKPFNPASLIKLLTTLYALETWSQEYVFHTYIGISDTVDSLPSVISYAFIYGEGDPLLHKRDIQMAFNRLRKSGIRKIADSLIINPMIMMNYNHTKRDTKYLLNKLIRRAGIRFTGKIVYRNEMPPGKIVATRKSPELIEILRQLNAHSINPIADRLGLVFGGPGTLENYFARLSGKDTSAFVIASCSGLGQNRLSPRDISIILRALKIKAEKSGIPLTKILPLNGIDGSSVANRLREMRFRRTFLAKSGTLIMTDSGVSALAGYIRTQNYGLVLFALMNMDGEVSFFRKRQDTFLRNLLANPIIYPVPFPRENVPRTWIYSARKWE